MPSIGSTIQRTPLVPAQRRRPPRRGTPSSGRAPSSRSRISALAGPVGLGDDVDRARLGGGDLDAARGAAARPARRPRGRSPARARAGRAGRRGAGRRSRPRPHSAGRGAARVGAAARRADGPSRPAGRRRPRARRVSPALDRGPLEQQVAHHRDEPRVGARRSRPAATRRPSRSAVAMRLGVEVVDDLHVVGDEADRDHHHRRRRPSPASSSRWSLTSGSSHGTCGGPDREQKTSSWA